jgi:MFS family permease
MKLPRTFAALKNPDYRLIWFGAVGSLTGAQMRQIANGYLAFELSGSAAVLALVTLGQALPGFFLAMFGGVIADRVKKRRLLLFTQTCIVLDSLSMAILVSTGLIEVWMIAFLAAIHGSVLSFNQPSRQAYMVELVEPAQMTNAIALYNSGQTCVRIIGPSIAGALIALPFVGTTYVFYVITAFYLIPVASLVFIKPRPEGPPRRRRALLNDFKDGLSYIKNNEVLKVLIIAGLIPPLLGNHYQQFLPVFASDKVLDVGPSGLGLMATATGIGAFLGSMSVATFGNMRRRGLVQLTTGAMFGVTLILFSHAPGFPFAIASLVVVGFMASSYQTLNSTLAVAASDQAYYGRVASVQQMNNSMSSFAVLPFGYSVDKFGAPTVVLCSGIAITLFWTFVGLFVPAYRRIELPQAEEEAEAAEGPPRPERAGTVT